MWGFWRNQRPSSLGLRPQIFGDMAAALSWVGWLPVTVRDNRVLTGRGTGTVMVAPVQRFREQAPSRMEAVPSGPAWLARPLSTNLHALGGWPARLVGTGARSSAQEITSTLTGHRLPGTRPRHSRPSL
jgi:hypothetical protein